jgi:hypothetical protein
VKSKSKSNFKLELELESNDDGEWSSEIGDDEGEGESQLGNLSIVGNGGLISHSTTLLSTPIIVP